MRKNLWAATLMALIASACAHDGRSQQATTRQQQPVVQQQPVGQQAQATQQQAAQQQAALQQPPGSAPGRTLADECIDLLNGRVQQGTDAATLRARCEGLLREGGAGTVAAAGVGTATPPPGETVSSGFTQVDRELASRRHVGLGMTSRGPVNNTVVTNPLGWFSGLGVNAAYIRPFPWEHASWLASARYSRTNATNGNVSAFGIGTGADLFVFGRNNEGLRIGPRLDLAFGRETVQGSSSFARLGVAGEIGFNFIHESGFSSTVGGGWGARLAGDAQDENFSSYTGGEDGPFLKLGMGYSW